MAFKGLIRLVKVNDVIRKLSYNINVYRATIANNYSQVKKKINMYSANTANVKTRRTQLETQQTQQTHDKNCKVNSAK